MVHAETILYVEDDRNYAELLQCALQQAGLKHRMIHFEDGKKAQAYIRGEGEYADRAKHPLPSVALVDLKMPGMNGFEFLDWLRNASPTRFLPVVVLTSSEDLKDVRKAYQLGANSFLVKPPQPEDLKEMMKMIEGFWMKFNIVADNS